MKEVAKPVGIIGAGVMGTGIAQTAAKAGWSVFLFDIDSSALSNSIQQIEKRVARLLQKKRISEEQSNLILEKIILTENLNVLNECDFIIECVPDSLQIKIDVFNSLDKIAPNAVLATNTSSLSITELESACTASGRILGTHFFNPAAIMPLVEIIKGNKTSNSATSRATLIVEAWGKTTVHPLDSPGFIVNRVARPYYIEAWRVLEDKIAPVDVIDDVMKSLGEFRMGPFELMDLLGHDLNYATSKRIWEDLEQPARLAPCDAQKQLIERNHLGRKTGCGAYAHDDRNNIVPAILTEQKQLELPEQLTNSVNAFCLEGAKVAGNKLERYIFARILASVINEAYWTHSEGVASINDIDTAMRLGTNYPYGPFEWCNRIGEDVVQELLLSLNETVQDNRFSTPPKTVGANS
ncbi:MAG: 3-hydroxyacyl-CoA dehydrogenase NAD-binding domain-containing protein [Phycisphaerales bacterium]|jgi:3-hydroxybutyryl-CoA dehydrogenase|nr:3-hydroxyacyl-CoA dehydrogenase NAD-binding domain-containing protein [Phycisphaerales bacterium]